MNNTIMVSAYIYTIFKSKKDLIYSDLASNYNNSQEALPFYLKRKDIHTKIKNSIKKSLKSPNADILDFTDDFEILIEECCESHDYISISSYIKGNFLVEVPSNIDCNDFSEIYPYCKKIEVESNNNNITVDDVEYDDYSINDASNYSCSNSNYIIEEDLNSTFIKLSM